MSRNYEISVREFLRLSREGGIDYADFIEHFTNVLRKINEKFGYLHTIHDINRDHLNEGLYGLPISVKDNICVAGMQSSAGSRILDGYVPFFDATSVKKVKVGGGKIIGKTNQDEFGFGTFSVNSGYEVPKNPLDPERTCGGSSGGAAGLAKAIRMPHIALAESTGGSISCPASFCGVIGLTPTYGLVSRYGLIDYANSLDKIGPIGDTVEDVALMLSIIAGHDQRDATSIARHNIDYTKHIKKNIKGMKIGVPKEYFKNIDPKVKKKVEGAIDKLEELGAKTKKISLPTTRFALSAYYIIATSEASTNLAKFSGLRYGAHEPLEGNFNEYFSHVRTKHLGEEAKRRIILGTFARMSGYRDAYYLKAMKVRTLIINDFKKAFKKVDVLAAPTMPILPPRFKEIERLKPLQHYQMDVLTVPPNLAGIPMISVPCGNSGQLPVGLHLMADHLQEGKIIEAASALESALVKGK